MVICLDEECKVHAPGAKLYCFNIHDYSVEPLPNFYKALTRLIKSAREGRRILVHCRAGCGRTGTLVAAYLILVKGHSYSEAVNTFMDKRGCGPETIKQHRLLELLDNARTSIGLKRTLEILSQSATLKEFYRQLNRADSSRTA